MPTFKQNPKDKALDDVYCPGQSSQNNDNQKKPEQSEVAANEAAKQDNTKEEANESPVSSNQKSPEAESTESAACTCSCEQKKEMTEETVHTEAPEKVLKAVFVPGPIVEDTPEKADVGNESAENESKTNLRGRSNPKQKLNTSGSVNKMGELGDDEIVEENLSGKAVANKPEGESRAERPRREPRPERMVVPVSDEDSANKPKFTSAKRRQRELEGDTGEAPSKPREAREPRPQRSQENRNQQQSKDKNQQAKPQAKPEPKKKGFFASVAEFFSLIFGGGSSKEAPKKQQDRRDFKGRENRGENRGEYNGKRHGHRRHRGRGQGGQGRQGNRDQQ